MAGKKDQSVVAVIDGLTNSQAANIQADIIRSKNKHAPMARAIATQGNRLDISNMISSGHNAVKQIVSKGVSANDKKK